MISIIKRDRKITFDGGGVIFRNSLYLQTQTSNTHTNKQKIMEDVCSKCLDYMHCDSLLEV